ncbi:hypothetical protein [Bradyrhizobium sp. WYCCWR 12699]|uniref:hypothetical protein n=1 Tax=Bradyrhizobium sp. WYCCWR 12699 TaxID=3064203 RepID=UPI0028A3E316|nr:hypothetical protein [Bradyrhizobium sp. WYCCWR 12699]MDT4737070.1 hypothetical protein [Bradyrhizobium sp. WYCCWR 12699]
MPSPKQMEKLARAAEQCPKPPEAIAGPGEPMPDELWDAVLRDPRAAGRPPLPIQQCRLSEIPRHVLRVECLRCFRTIEMQKADAVRYYGPHAVWKDVGQRLLDQTCAHRTGRLEEDGCWPNWSA